MASRDETLCRSNEGEVDLSIPPHALTNLYPYSLLRGKLLIERPSSVDFNRWLLRYEIDRYGSESHFHKIYGAIGDWLHEALATTDMSSPAASYTPVDGQFVRQYYQEPDRSLIATARERLIAGHSPRNAIVMAVDPQVAFAAAPGSPQARKVIKERSYCAANLAELADFIRETIDLKSWVVLTTMQQGLRTTVDRWQQQQGKGLVDSDGRFLLCPEGSSDVMIHPLLLERLGFSPEEIRVIQYNLLVHTLLRDADRVCLPGRDMGPNMGLYRSFGDHLPVMVKPQRTLDGENIRQIMAVKPTDIFFAGADIHMCVAEAAEQLKLGIDYQPNIWIIHDLATTRPADFNQAQEIVSQLADGNHYIYLCNKQEALTMLGRNRIKHRLGNALYDSSLPPLFLVIDDLFTNIVKRCRFGKNN